MSEGLFASYWEGAKRGVLLFQKCDACGSVRHYPRLLCSNCYSSESSFVEGGSTGRVHSWTAAHHAFGTDLPAELPYVMVIVDFPAGPRVLGVLEGTSPRIGLPVRVRFRDRGPCGTPVPFFEADGV